MEVAYLLRGGSPQDSPVTGKFSESRSGASGAAHQVAVRPVALTPSEGPAGKTALSLGWNSSPEQSCSIPMAELHRLAA